MRSVPPSVPAACRATTRKSQRPMPTPAGGPGSSSPGFRTTSRGTFGRIAGATCGCPSRGVSPQRRAVAESAGRAPPSSSRRRRRLDRGPRGKGLVDLRRQWPADGRPAEPFQVVRIVLREVRDGPSFVSSEVEAALGGAVSRTHAPTGGATRRGCRRPPVGRASAIGFPPIALPGIRRARRVVGGPSRRVGEDRPRIVDRLHRRHAAAGVGVVLAGERSERGADHLGLRRAGHLKDFVVVGHEPERTRRIARGQ